jgi:hypothetical protein
MVEGLFLVFSVFYVLATIGCLTLRKYHPLFVSFIPFVNIYCCTRAAFIYEQETKKTGIKKSIMAFEIKGDGKNGC